MASARISREFGILFGFVGSLCFFAMEVRADSVNPEATAFGTMPTFSAPKLSPDGRRMFFLTRHETGLPVGIVHDFETEKNRLLIASEADRFDLVGCEWANAERLLCDFFAIQRAFGTLAPTTRLVAVNADGSEMKVLLQKALRDNWAQFQNRIVDFLPDERKKVLIQMPKPKGDLDPVWGVRGLQVSELDIYNGRTKKRENVHSQALAWVSDGRGIPRLRFLYKDRKSVWQARRSGETEWRTLHESVHEDFNDRYEPLGFGEDPDELLLLRRYEGRVALFSHDLTGKREDRLVFSNPEVDLWGALKMGKYGRMVAVGYSTDRNHWHFFDAEVEAIHRSVSGALPGRELFVADESWDRRFYLLYAGSDVEAGQYYLVDRVAKSLKALPSRYPKLAGRNLAPMTPLHYAARDGRQIPAYLTQPASAAEGLLPAIVMPHGGPHSRDYWGYNWLAQFLAARGYAVLQSNFRGSEGFGEEWSGEGGFRDWRSAIDDLTDGARYLAESGVADPQRICILGWSYGGYAALLSAVEEPDLYRCAVSIAGVSDLHMLIEDRRDLLAWRINREFIGRDPKTLDAGSPAQRAQEIEVPVLLFHGDEDVNVYVRHSRAMAKALRKHDKSVDYVEYEEVEHSIRRNTERIHMLTRIGSFLDTHTVPVEGSRLGEGAAAAPSPVHAQAGQ